ncbi:MAG: imidazolonepropionase [Acidimicrobiia bacterium]|nr:imidazolonepropionase [Acidimicrobiia bacterium]
MSTVIDNIGLLVTNRDEGDLTDAWIAIDGALVVATGTGKPPAADRRIDAERRCVIPGFVDSHTHLIFAGDRSAEFAARMSGLPYEAGGIRTTVEATRAATAELLTELATARMAEAHRAGITTIEIKSGYGLDLEHELISLQIGERLTSEVTFLGAHVVPYEFLGRADDYVHLVTGDMMKAAAEHASWVDAFCEVGAFDEDQSRAILEAGRASGLGLRLHANQLGPGPGAQLAVEMDCASADHCTFLSDDDIDALAGSSTVVTFLPATEFSTKQPYPDARRVLDAGATVAIATNCNPGSSYTTSMSLCVALAVREMGMTIREALQAATSGGAAALRRDDIGWLGAGSRSDMVVLDAPSYDFLVYRPGVPQIALTMIGGKQI